MKTDICRQKITMEFPELSGEEEQEKKEIRDLLFLIMRERLETSENSCTEKQKNRRTI